MKQEQSNILDKLGKDPGFKVPDNYFEKFNRQMLDSLPEVKITDVDQPTSIWTKARPFVYMAAMFVGVFLMITMFKMMNNTGAQDQRKADAEINAIMDTPTQTATSPSILNYEDSVHNNLQASPK